MFCYLNSICFVSNPLKIVTKKWKKLQKIFEHKFMTIFEVDYIDKDNSTFADEGSSFLSVKCWYNTFSRDLRSLINESPSASIKY